MISYRIYIFPNNHRSGTKKPFLETELIIHLPGAHLPLPCLGEEEYLYLYIYIFVFSFLSIYIYDYFDYKKNMIVWDVPLPFWDCSTCTAFIFFKCCAVYDMVGLFLTWAATPEIRIYLRRANKTCFMHSFLNNNMLNSLYPLGTCSFGMIKSRVIVSHELSLYQGFRCFMDASFITQHQTISYNFGGVSAPTMTNPF